MPIKIGDTLVLYTARNNKLNIHEGTIKFDKRYRRNFVIFNDGRPRERVPNEGRIGHIQGGGPRLWLFERDDDLARKLFLEYEREKLKDLEKQLERKKQLIKTLEDGMEV